MSKITLSMEAEDLKQARIIALQQGTSLDAVIRDFIKRYINHDAHFQQLTERLLQHSKNVNVLDSERDWTREELYDRKGLL